MSAISLKVPPYWFKEINKLLTGFLWSDKKTRISYKRLIRPRKTGGLDVYSYYFIYNARFPLKWIEGRSLSERSNSISLSASWFYLKTTF